MRTIEDYFLDLVKGQLNEREKKYYEEYICKYTTFKSRIIKDYFPLIPQSCPYYTDHGIDHINAINQSNSQLLGNYYDEVYVPAFKSSPLSSSLDIMTCFVILTSTLCHDIGMIFGREDHEKNVMLILGKYSDIINNQKIMLAIKNVISCHSGRAELSKISTDYVIQDSQQIYHINLRAIAAMLRLSDEISENSSRVNNSQFELNEIGKCKNVEFIPEENEVHLVYAGCIGTSLYDLRTNCIRIEYLIEKKNATKKYKYRQKDGTVTQQSFIDYVLHRIEKINSEIRLCAKEFRCYAIIDSLVISMQLLDENQLPINSYTITEEIYEQRYAPMHIVRDFYNKYKHWKPSEIKKVK